MYQISRHIKRLLCFGGALALITVCFFDLAYYDGPLRDEAYRTAVCAVLNKENIGSDFAECFDKLYLPKSSKYGLYNVLYEQTGNIDRPFNKGITYSYYARFYICEAIDTSDGLLRPFCYVIYFDENQKSVYVKLISDNRGG